MIKCKECDKKYKRNCDLTRHINSKHSGLKIYYDKYLIKNGEGFCEMCGEETEFVRFDRGYKIYCSEKCRKKGRVDKIESTNYEKYGVRNVNKLKNVRDKIKKTNLEKYGNSCPMQNEIQQKKIQEKNLKNLGVKLPFQSKEIQDKSAIIRKKKYGAPYTYQSSILQEKIKQTNLKKYGFEYPLQNKNIQEKLKKTIIRKYGKEYIVQVKEIQDKIKNTLLTRYGEDNPMKLKFIKEKFKQTNLKRYGVEYPLQNREIFDKHQGNRFKRKIYKDTNLHYQGSYEYDFLEKYLDKFSNIKNGPTIRYFYDDKCRTYYPDFFIPSLNLIIEIKGSYFLKENLEYKKEACINSGFNWIMIINKDYSKFENLILF